MATPENNTAKLEDALKDKKVLVVDKGREVEMKNVLEDANVHECKLGAKGLKVEIKDGEITTKTVEEAEKIPLLFIGKVFMVDGNEYKVCYINVGQNRFSATPHKK